MHIAGAPTASVVRSAAWRFVAVIGGSSVMGTDQTEEDTGIALGCRINEQVLNLILYQNIHRVCMPGILSALHNSIPHCRPNRARAAAKPSHPTRLASQTTAHLRPHRESPNSEENCRDSTGYFCNLREPSQFSLGRFLAQQTARASLSPHRAPHQSHDTHPQPQPPQNTPWRHPPTPSAPAPATA